MKTIKTLALVIIGIMVLIIGLIFSLANMTPVTLRFYHFETIAIPLWFLVIISALAGAIFTIFLILLDLYRGFRKLTKLKKDLKSLQKEISNLKCENETLAKQKNSLEKSIHEKPSDGGPDRDSREETSETHGDHSTDATKEQPL